MYARWLQGPRRVRGLWDAVRLMAAWLTCGPCALQGAMALQQLAPYDPSSWKLSIWQVANAPHTFIAMRSLDKPPQQAANDVKPW